MSMDLLFLRAFPGRSTPLFILSIVLLLTGLSLPSKGPTNGPGTHPRTTSVLTPQDLFPLYYGSDG